MTSAHSGSPRRADRRSIRSAGSPGGTRRGVRGEAAGRTPAWRAHLGWRPLASSGFGFEAGYGLVALGGDVRTGAVIVAATGEAPPPGTSVRYEVVSMLHQIDLEVDWTWLLLDDHLALRAGLGFAGTVASSTVITPVAPSTLTEKARVLLDDVYTSYAFVPVLSLAVGYRF